MDFLQMRELPPKLIVGSSHNGSGVPVKGPRKPGPGRDFAVVRAQTAQNSAVFTVLFRIFNQIEL
jgi:hypothetical protein